MGQSRARALRTLLLIALTQCGDDGARSTGPTDDPQSQSIVVAVVAPPAPFIGWPLRGAMPSENDPSDGPYSHQIVSVFDHSNASLQRGGAWLYQPDGTITSVGNLQALGTRPFGKSPCYELEPKNNPTGLLQAFGLVYDGPLGLTCRPTDGWLAYDNHPGYDYRAGRGTPVFAPFDGVVSYVGPGPGSNDAASLHAMTICARQQPAQLPGRSCYAASDKLTKPSYAVWRVRLLHLDSWPRKDGSIGRGPALAEDCPAFENTPCANEGKEVTSGMFLGYVGSYGATAPHLHLEVLDPETVPRDPYGWQSAATDPMGPYSNAPLWTNAYTEPCQSSFPPSDGMAYALGASVGGTLQAGSCVSPLDAAERWAVYKFAVPTSRLVKFELSSATMSSFSLSVEVDPGAYMGFFPHWSGGKHYLLIRAGTSWLSVSTLRTPFPAEYTLTTVSAPSLATCPLVFTAYGVSASLNLAAGCSQMFMFGGGFPANVVIRVTAAGFTPLVEIRDDFRGPIIGSTAGQIGPTALLNMNVPPGAIPVIYVSAVEPGSLGPYTIVIGP